ncbi:hypothetical protein [Cellulomonas soli]
MSLRTRLVTIIAVLLGAGLVLAGAATATLLRGTLIGQVDDKLVAEAGYQAKSALYGQSLGDYAPSDYYVRWQFPDLEKAFLSRAALEQYGAPSVPDIGADEATEAAGIPFTTRSSVAGSRWRAVAYPCRTCWVSRVRWWWHFRCSTSTAPCVR